MVERVAPAYGYQCQNKEINETLCWAATNVLPASELFVVATLKRRREGPEGFRPAIDRALGRARLASLPCNYSRGPTML
jgi:hypothetical protein